MWRLVVAWDGNVNKSEWGFSVAECNNRDVNVGSLSDGLVVNVRVGHNKETRLSESSLKKTKEIDYFSIVQLNLDTRETSI